MKEKEEDSRSHWTRGRMLGLMALMFAFNILVLTLLYQRYIFITTLLSVAMGVVAFRLVKNPGSGMERLFNRLFTWGFYWFLIGILLDP